MNNNNLPRNYAGPQPPNFWVPRAGGHAPPAAAVAYNDNDDDDEEAPGPLIIRILAPLNIQGSNNICTTDPAELSQRVSQSIASAIRQLGGAAGNGGAGIPMIDGRGAPRRIEAQVDVGTRIEGEGNLVGEKEVVERIGRWARGGGRFGIGGRGEGDAGIQDVCNDSPARAQRIVPREVVVKREPLDEVRIVNGPINPIAARSERHGVPNSFLDRSPSPTLDGTATPSINGTPIATPKGGGKRKSARIAHDDEVASDAGLGINTRPDREAVDYAVKRPRRG